MSVVQVFIAQTAIEFIVSCSISASLVSVIGTQLGQIWQAGPIKKTTRADWNNAHLHQNPNEGVVSNHLKPA